MASPGYDFSGYVARYNVPCTDGTTIKPNCFSDMDGEQVPLVYQHNHDSIGEVIGHCELENRPQGLYGYAYCNDDVAAGRNAKALVKHGDVNAFSVWANELQRTGGDIMHGVVKEVSLVLAGADKTALIDSIVHDDMSDDEAEIAFLGGYGELELAHADAPKKKKEAEAANEGQETKDDDTANKDEAPKEDKKVANSDKNDDKTVQDVLDTFNDEQRMVLNYIVGKAIEDAKKGNIDDEDEDDDEDEEDEEVKHNVFESDYDDTNYISHADQGEILGMAKQSNIGTFKNAVAEYAAENGIEIEHDDNGGAIIGGFSDSDGTPSSLGKMFPEYQDINPGAPELITSDQGWISTVLAKVHKSPISRVRTSEVDIRNIDSLRAKGYQKGNKKGYTGNFSLIRRTTDPQTVYVKSALNRDDIVDITDFDYVQYLYNIDKLMLNEELATAIMIGDGREEADEGKIFPEHIRPIWTDDELYVKHVTLDLDKAKAELNGTSTNANFGDSYIFAEAVIEALLHARETNFRGSGTPDFYCTPNTMNRMLLARDMNGRRIYGTKTELQAALNIGNIITAEQFAGKTRKTEDGKTMRLLGILGNLADYNVGSTKGGQITQFTQFDIDFNQQKSLIETRLSGAVYRIYSFIVLEEEVKDTTSGAKANKIAG